MRLSETGNGAVDLAKSWDPGMILLDIGLPDISGTEVATKIRAFSGAPILMVTAMGETENKIEGLELGADDYIVKPFVMDELLARLRAAARRAAMPKPSGSVLEYGDVRMDLEAEKVWVGGKQLDLKEREFEILRMLMSRAGTIVRRDEIARAIWDLSPAQAANSLDVHMSWLRSKLADNPKEPRYIETIRGKGFRFLAG